MHLGLPSLLSALTDIDKYDAYLRKQLGTSPPDDLVLGYAFLVSLMLERLIDIVLLNPMWFGVEWNEYVERSFQTDVPFDAFPGRSNVGRIVRNIAAMYRSLPAARTATDLRSGVKSIRGELIPALSEWTKQFTFYGGNDRHKINLNELTEKFASLFLINTCHDIRWVKVAFNHTFQHARRFEPQFHGLPAKIGHQLFYRGFVSGVVYLWYSVLGRNYSTFKSISGLLAAKDWNEYERIFELVISEIVGQNVLQEAIECRVQPKRGCFSQLAKRSARAISDRSEFERRLDEKFVLYDIRVVSERVTAKSTKLFLLNVIGTISYSGKARVLRFVHTEKNGRERFSFAIFVPVPTRIGNQSEWILFYDFCDNYSPRGISGSQAIESFLQTYKTKLAVSSLRVSATELIEYVNTHPDVSKSVMHPITRENLEIHTVSGLRRLLAAARMENSDARGLILELLVLNIVDQLGYATKWRVRTPVLGKEIDVLGLKKSKGKIALIIAECSTRFSRADIEELQTKLKLVESKSKEIVKLFPGGMEGPCEIVGWLVSTTPIPQKIDRHLGNITVFGWNEFLEYCSERGFKLPIQLVSLFKRMELSPENVIIPPTVMGLVKASMGGPSDSESPKTVYLHDGFLR